LHERVKSDTSGSKIGSYDVFMDPRANQAARFLNEATDFMTRILQNITIGLQQY